jgi:hypothetical protein
MSQNENLPARPEVTNILNEAQQNSTFEKMLKFNRGKYLCDDTEIPLGTKVVAHCVGWAKEWIKFKDSKFIERKIYRVARGERAPERDQLDETNELLWAKGFSNMPKDPWVFRYLLPVQIVDTDEPLIFVTPSFGGRRAVDDLCKNYALRAARDPNCGQPICRLQSATFQTANFGAVQKPKFEIIGWDDGKQSPREVSEEALKESDFDDLIPF